MMASDVLLSVDALDVFYGDFQALRQISFKVTKGTVVSVIGANGAGKSTLLQTISGLQSHSTGKINFMGRDMTGSLPHQMVAEGLAMVPEGGRVFPKLTVSENLIIGAYTPKARKKKDKLIRKVYDLFPVLQEKAHQLAGNLSGGQRQMLAIGRALMSDPQLILFDEISLGLAPTVIKDIYRQIKVINQEGTTIVLVEQDVRRSLKASQASYVMLEGSIILSGNSSELVEEDVRKAYFGV